MGGYLGGQLENSMPGCRTRILGQSVAIRGGRLNRDGWWSSPEEADACAQPGIRGGVFVLRNE